MKKDKKGVQGWHPNLKGIRTSEWLEASFSEQEYVPKKKKKKPKKDEEEE